MRGDQVAADPLLTAISRHLEAPDDRVYSIETGGCMEYRKAKNGELIRAKLAPEPAARR